MGIRFGNGVRRWMMCPIGYKAHCDPLSQWDLTGSDGNPAESAQGRRIAMMDLHANRTDYLWKGPNKAKQDRQPPLVLPRLG